MFNEEGRLQLHHAAQIYQTVISTCARLQTRLLLSLMWQYVTRSLYKLFNPNDVFCFFATCCI